MFLYLLPVENVERETLSSYCHEQFAKNGYLHQIAKCL